MNILYDHDFFSSFRYSGISRYFFELLSRLSIQKDICISLYMGFHINEFGFEHLRPHLHHFFGKKRLPIPKTHRLCTFLNNSLLPICAKLWKPTLYHQTYYQYFIPHFKGTRIVTAYDMVYEIFPEMFPIKDRPIIDKKNSIGNADGIIAISESTKQDLMRLWGIPPERIRVIYLANSLNIPNPPAPSGNQEPYILYVGQRIAHKNFQFLLNAFGQSSKIHRQCRLVCFGGSLFTNQERELMERYGILNRVKQISGPDTLLAQYYKHAVALVYPSKYEGFGLPLLEAMHYECPVVVSNTSSLTEIGGDAVLYFNPTNTDELMHSLEKIIFNESLRQTLISKGVKREKLFSWDRCAKETYAFYKEVSNKD